jgi:host factor-I protein
MSPAPAKPAQPNIQDVFLNYLRREKLAVTIRMMDGSEIEGRVKNFDRFALVLEQGGTDHLVFKHAIAVIKTPKAVANYFSHQ